MKYYLKDENFQEPQGEELYCIVASNGIFRVRRKPISHTCSQFVTYEKGWKKVDLPGLLPHESDCKIFTNVLPKFPLKMIKQAVAFFQAVYNEHKSEALVLIAWDNEAGEYVLLCPKQEVSGGHLDSDIDPAMLSGLQLIGDIHSHGGMSAGYSTTDENDEKYSDGFHIIAGQFSTIDSDKEWFDLDWSCCYVMDGDRFKYDKGWFKFIDEDDDGEYEFPPEWMNRVTKKKWVFHGKYKHNSNYTTPLFPDQRYDQFDDNRDWRDWRYWED